MGRSMEGGAPFAEPRGFTKNLHGACEARRGYVHAARATSQKSDNLYPNNDSIRLHHGAQKAGWAGFSDRRFLEKKPAGKGRFSRPRADLKIKAGRAARPSHRHSKAHAVSRSGKTGTRSTRAQWLSVQLTEDFARHTSVKLTPIYLYPQVVRCSRKRGSA